MDSDEVFGALSRFRDGLPAYLAELGASAKMPQPLRPRQSAIRLTVITVQDSEKAYLAMVGFAVRHRLQATLIRTGLLSVASFAPLVKPAHSRLCVLLRPIAATDVEPRPASLA